MSFIIWLFALICLSHSTATILGDDSIPWALTFGPSTITASRWHAPGNITTRTFVADASYKNFADTAITFYKQQFQVHGQRYIMSGGRKVPSPHVEFDKAASTKIIESAVDRVKRDLGTELRLEPGQVPTLAALYIPTFFNDSVAMAFSYATFPNGRFTKRYGFKREGQSQQAACYAYGLDRCEIMGDPEECAVFYPTPGGLSFVIELEESYVHLHALASFPKDQGFPSERDAYNNTLGADTGLKALGAEVYRQELHGFIKTFVRRMPQAAIKAIVGMGGASPELIAELLEIARLAVGNGAKVYDTIDPSVVVAHGAALYARDTALDPKYQRGLIDDVKDQHDEL